MPPVNSVSINVGRLLEIRIEAFHKVQDVEQFAKAVTHVVSELPRGRSAVLAADWRSCPVLAPAVADAVTIMLRRSSPRIERNGLLHAPEQSTCLFQLFRVVQEANNPQRRLFTDPNELITWLAELLEPSERTQLHAFLMGPARSNVRPAPLKRG